MFPLKINGITYNSYQELPPAEKEDYDKKMGLAGDRNGNNLPDFMDGEFAQSIWNATRAGFVLRGKTYASLDEMPADMRAEMITAFNNLWNNGMPHPIAYELIYKKKVSIFSNVV